MLIRMTAPLFPIALGVIREVSAPSYSDRLKQEQEISKERAKYHTMDELLNSGETWEVK
jgi:2-oxoglutarate ferredoxin oxidoreductase subunit beta